MATSTRKKKSQRFKNQIFLFQFCGTGKWFCSVQNFWLLPSTFRLFFFSVLKRYFLYFVSLSSASQKSFLSFFHLVLFKTKTSTKKRHTRKKNNKRNGFVKIRAAHPNIGFYYVFISVKKLLVIKFL